MSRQQIEKYDAWIVEVERRQKELAGSRTGYLRFFFGVLLASALGYFWNPLVGAGSLITGLLFCGFGFYTVLFREDEYVKELANLRKVVADLRAKRAKEEGEEGGPPATELELQAARARAPK